MDNLIVKVRGKENAIFHASSSCKFTDNRIMNSESVNDEEIMFLPTNFEDNKTDKTNEKLKYYDIKYTVNVEENTETDCDNLEELTKAYNDALVIEGDTSEKDKLLIKNSMRIEKTRIFNGEIDVEFEEKQVDELLKDDTICNFSKTDESSEDNVSEWKQ